MIQVNYKVFNKINDAEFMNGGYQLSHKNEIIQMKNQIRIDSILLVTLGSQQFNNYDIVKKVEYLRKILFGGIKFITEAFNETFYMKIYIENEIDTQFKDFLTRNGLG